MQCGRYLHVPMKNDMLNVNVFPNVRTHVHCTHKRTYCVTIRKQRNTNYHRVAEGAGQKIASKQAKQSEPARGKKCAG